MSPGSAVFVRAQDRDELARIFTEHNARRNSISGGVFEAHAEPLLAGPPGCRWDIILTNIPAKAGRPVLEDFIRRSASLLKKDGRVFLVAVNTLADFFRSRIAAASAPLLLEESGREHSVFVFGHSEAGTQSGARSDPPHENGPLIFDESFPKAYPFYIRNSNRYEIEGIPYRLDTIHGAADFDNPGGGIQAAAKLFVKLGLAAKLAEAAKTQDAALLIHDAGQGHFALWLAHYLDAAGRSVADTSVADFRWVLSGRNVVALASARSALNAAFPGIKAALLPATGIFPDRGFALTAFFHASPFLREMGFSALPGSIVIAGMTSAEAERFDRKKPEGLHRLGDIKRKGFRAMAYQVRQALS